MKFRLSLLLNASIIVCTPLAVSVQGKSGTKSSKTIQELSTHKSDVYNTMVPPVPTYDDYDDVDSYEVYWYTEAFKTHYDMTFAYRILKKLINFEGQKLDKLPYKEKLKEFNVFKETEFDDLGSTYTFSVHNLLYWTTFIKLWEDVKFNYGDYLVKQFKKMNVDSTSKVTDDLRTLATFKDFDTKNSDIFALRTFVSHFEAIKLFVMHKDNTKIKDLLIKIFKVESGINTGSIEYNNTLKDTLPIFRQLKEEAKESLIEQLEREVEEENKYDKLKYDALLSARRAFGSLEFNKIIRLVKQVINSSTQQLLEELKNTADSIYLSEKQKVIGIYEELKDKDKFKDRVDNARNVGILRDIYSDITTQKIKEFQEKMASLVEKTSGSNDYNDFKNRFDAIRNKNAESEKQKRTDKEVFEKKWKDFGANHIMNKVDIKVEKEKQRAKLEVQIQEQEVILEQLKALKQEVENEFLDEKQKTLNAINKILEKNVKDEELKKVDKAKNITELKLLAQNATRIRNNEDLLNARADAKKAVERTKGSKNYNEYEKRRITFDGETAKLLVLINDANGEYEAKSNEVKANIDSLDDKKDFEDKFENVKNIADLEELNKKILPEKKIQDLARAQKRAKTAVESTNGSKQYEAFLKRLNDNNEKTDELNKLASEAENVYNDEKQKVVDVFDKLLDKKQYKDKIDKAINITSLKALFIEISTEKARQDTADAIKKIEGSKKHQEQMKNFEKNRENIEELKKITEKAKEEFNNVLKEVQIELNKLSDTNFKKNEFKEKIQNANSIAILKQIKLQIQDEISEQQKKQSKPKTTDKKENENKTNVAAIVTPLVLIPSIAAAGFGIWYAIKHRKKSIKN